MHRRAIQIAPMKVLAALVALTVAATLTAYVNQAQAVITTPFDVVFSQNANGSIVLRGNSNLTCPPAATGCADALNGIPSAAGESLNNNGYVMQNRDVDADPATFNSSTADVTLPSGSTVLYAALYWSAYVSAGTGGTAAPTPADRNKVKFSVPNRPYATVTATTVDVSGNAYQGMANVTPLVAGAGNGTFGVADIQAALGQDRYAGWALVLAYQNPAESMRNLRIYDGFGVVSSGSTSVNISIGGFQTPQYGAVNTKIGTVVYEGDLGKTGDTLQLNGESMSDAANPANNFFNSTVSDGGTRISARNPGNSNLLGVDVDQFDANGKLANNATSATLTLTTASGGETFFPGVVTFSTDLYAPNLTATMTGRDVNGGRLLPGDELEYTVDVKNDGTDTAIESVLTNAIPAGTTYVPGSLTIAGNPVSDAAGDDTGDFKTDTAQGAGVFRIGADATATVGGKLIPNATTRVTFRVKVDLTTPGGFTILNTAAVDYTGEHTSRKIAGTSSASGVTVDRPTADLAAGLTVSPGVVQRGGPDDPVTYQATVTNRGGDLEPRAVGTLTLPTGVTAGPLPADCSISGQIVTCDLGPLAANTSATRQIDAVVDATANASAVARLVASGTGSDTVDGNDLATAALGVNTAPTAQDDTDNTADGTPVDVRVLANDSDPDDTDLTVSVETSPAHGAAVANADGTITYTPAHGYVGTDSFRYRVSDGRGGSDTAEVTVTTVLSNAAPIAVDDRFDVPYHGSAVLDVVGGDTDPNGDPLTVTAVTQPDKGSVDLTGGVVTYTGPAGFSGTTTFGYTISDGRGGTASATATVVVANAAPTAVAVTASGPYGQPIRIDVLTPASDPNGDTLTVAGAVGAGHGMVTVDSDGTLVYTGNPKWSGVDGFDFTVSDGKGGTATARVTVTVLNGVPVARPDAVTAETSVALVIPVLANDTDPNDDPLTVTIDADPAHGTATVGADGRVTYTPAAGYRGPDSFHYLVSDGRGGQSGATVTLTVINSAPVANPDAQVTPTDTPVVVAVLDNDTDASRDPMTITGFTNGTHGTVTRSGADKLLYTPARGFTGTDTFTYTIEDPAHGTSSATVTITVLNAAPIAVPDTFTVRPGVAAALPVLTNDTDPNLGQILRLLSVAGGSKGTVAVGPGGTVTYTADAGASGTDTFDYTVTDDNGGTATGTVVVTIDQAPIARPDAVNTGTGAPVVIAVLGNDSDPEGGALTVVSVGTPANGTARVNPDNTIRYAPAGGFAGTDTFTYVVRDAAGGTATGTVTVTVANAVPVATADVAAVATGKRVDIDVLANDTDVNTGQTLTVDSLGNPAHGTVTKLADGKVRYTPAPGYSGTDRFTYVVSDGNGGTATGTVTVTVTDGRPVALPDSGTTPYLRPITVKVLGNDLNPENRTLTVTGVTQPSSGTVVISGDSVTYRPVDGFSGTVTFDYTVRDSDGDVTGSAVTIVVGTPPAVPDKAATAEPGAPVKINLPLKDEQDRPVRVISVGKPSNGTARLDANGNVIYTPAKGFVGTDSFRYFAEDADGNTAWATVKVTVPGPQSPPTAKDDAISVPAGGSVVVHPIGNDTDPDKDKLTITKVGKPRHGVAVLNPDGSVTYAPDKTYAGGADSFTYTITDGHGHTATATVKVTITEVVVADTPVSAHLPKTGTDIMSVAGTGMLALLVGVVLYGLSLRGGLSFAWVIGGSSATSRGGSPEASRGAARHGAGTRRRGPGRHRPGRHRQSR